MKVTLVVMALTALCGCAGEYDGELPADELDAQNASSDAAATADAGPLSTEPTVNRLLDDGHLLGGQRITEATVQEFLYAEGSFLAGYSDPVSSQSAASIIVERSVAYGVSPLYMLARIQTESSLVSSGSSANLDAATGCGCPDSSGCNPELGGFGNQVECAAMKLRGYYVDLDAGAATVSGWQVGVLKETLDPCDVVPENKATAALYTYTPWVGAYVEGCGRSDIGGSSLVALIYHRFANARSW